MKIILIALTFIFLVIGSNAQTTNCCKDTIIQPDTFYPCYTPQYEPVCGCDLVTYRNACAAEHWGGLVNNGYCPLGWTDGICGNFDFDFIPSGITYQPVQLSIYLKKASSATVYIYNRYGALMSSFYFRTYNSNEIVSSEINFQGFEIGIYLAMVVVNGEQQTKKFGKMIDSK